MSTPQDNALGPDDSVTIPRIKMGEVGFTGLRVINKSIIEETQRSFRFPMFLKTVEEMRNNPTVGAAMNVYRMMINRVQWSVEPPVGATDKEKARANMVDSMMHDMDGSWEEFIQSVIPYIEYGFGVHEIVLRRRLNKTGSKFNDGIVGIGKLAPRSQDTIVGWVFDETGSDLVAVEQTVQYLQNSQRYLNRTNIDGRIVIPREKFLLFTSNPSKGNPQGNSIYKNIYLAFKQLSILQEQQLVGISKDVQGILKIEIPAMYLDPSASDDQRATAAAFQNIIDNYNAGTQRGLLVPRIIDENNNSLFGYELMVSKGTSPYDLESIIKGLQGDILSALNVDILKLGDASGSFSLAEAKTSILSLAIDSRLKEIASTLNHALIPMIYQMNGWEITNLPKFTYGEPEEIDLESFSSAIQRIFATSAIEVDRDTLNRVRKMIGVPELPEDEPVHVDMLPINLSGVESKSGKGMSIGTSGVGTARNPYGQGDSSVANKENP